MMMMAHQDERRGYVLVTVLLLIVLLAGLLLQFNRESRTKLEVSDSRLQAAQAASCAEAGLTAALAAIRSDGRAEAILEAPLHLRIEGAGECTVTVSLENGKLNANGLRMTDGQLDRRRIECILRLIDLLNRRYPRGNTIGYGIVPAIIDWTDPDTDLTHLPFIERENEGAENEYYQGLARPYQCKNGPLDSVRELLLVRGITPEVFEGPAGGSGTGRAVPGLGQLVTVYGDGKVDINHSPRLVVESLSELIDPVLMQSIVDHRPYASMTELAGAPGMSMKVMDAVGGLITMKTVAAFYRIESVGRVGAFERRIAMIAATDGKTDSATVLLREEQ